MGTTSLPGDEVNLRQYTMRLLSRYLYVSGEHRSAASLTPASTEAHFHMLKDPQHTRKTLADLERRKSVSLLGLNDNVESGEVEVKRALNEWFEKRWPQPAPWERSYPQG